MAKVRILKKISLSIGIISLFCLSAFVIFILVKNAPFVHADQTGTLSVCNIIADGGGNIVDGSAKSGTTFKITWPDVNPLNPSYVRTSSILPDTQFTTPLSLNTVVDNFPNGPGSGGKNAMCTKYTNVPLTYNWANGPNGEYYYNQETINKPGWNTPRYNDGWRTNVDLTNLFAYTPQLFDSDLSNDDFRNGDSDGHILINVRNNFERILVIFNQYNGNTLPGTGCTNTDCSYKTVGQFQGVGNNYISADTMQLNNTAWVRLEVHGKKGTSGNPVSVTLNEQINNAYFKVEPPLYSANPTFKITRLKMNAEIFDPDLSTALCPDNLKNSTNTPGTDGIPDCISGISSTGYTIKLPALDPTNTYYVYFQATPTAQTPLNTQINVDSNASTITYNDTTPISLPLANKQVTISGSTPYFQIAGGDIYSKGSATFALKDELPAGIPFALQNTNTITQYSNPHTYGSGNAPSLNMSNYTVSSGLLYTKYYETYKKTITAQAIAIQPSSGVYLANVTNGRVNIGGATWQTITSGNNILIFVPGDLYITSNITIPKDSQTFLGFIVQGNIGVDPSVTQLDGLYLSDGLFDSTCSQLGSFNSSNDCSPDLGSVGTFTPLNLNGFFYAIGGYNLDRTGNIGSLPGELFSYRPDFLLSGITSLGEKKMSWKEQKN